MRANRTFVGFVSALLTAAITIPVTASFASSNSETGPMTAATVVVSAPAKAPAEPASSSKSESFTETSAAYAHNSVMNFACRQLDTLRAQEIMGQPTLKKIDTDGRGEPSQCLLGTPESSPAISLHVYEETQQQFDAAYLKVVERFKTAKQNGYPIYRDVFEQRWPVGSNQAMPHAKAAFSVQPPRSNDTMLYANDGEYTIRIKLDKPSDAARFALAEQVMTELADRRATLNGK